MTVRALAIARGVSVIGATAAIIAAATYAATFNTNTVAAQDINLNVSNDVLRIYDFDGAGYDATHTTNPGGSVQIHNITLVPGTESEHKPFYLKNLSANSFNLTAKANNPSLTGIGDTTKVHVYFYNKDNVQTGAATLADLMSGDQPTGLTIGPNATGSSASAVDGNYLVSFKIDLGALTGTSASVHSLDLLFTGTATVPDPTPTPAPTR